MHINRNEKGKKTLRTYFIGALILWPILTGLDLWLWLTGTHPAIMAYPVILILMLVFCFFYFRRYYFLDYSADAAGIRVFSGRKTFKNVPWHEFRFVGELDVSISGVQNAQQKLIVCSPEPPAQDPKKAGCFTFPRKNAIMIDYTPEDAQILRPYYRGIVSTL